MLKKLIMLVCLVSFWPAAVGAQDLAVLQQAQVVADSGSTREVDLSLPAVSQKATILAANDTQGRQMTESERPKKTHYGLTFGEFVDVHFGDYRWVWWAAAAAALVAIHVAAAD